MKLIPIVLALICLLDSSAAFAQDFERDRMRARDRSAYVLSLTGATTRGLCTAVVKDFDRAFDQVFPKWLERNKEGISRGRAETILSLGRGANIDEYEADVVSGLSTQFSALAKDKKKTRCLGTIYAYSQ